MLARTKAWLDERPWAWALIAALATLAMLALVSCAFPDIALADPDAGGEEEEGSGIPIIGDIIDGATDLFETVTDPVGKVVAWITDLISKMILTLFGMAWGMAGKIADTEVLLDFRHMFGGDSTAVYEFVKVINDSLVTTVGYTFLAIVMLIKLANLGQRMDGNGTLPAVKEVFLLIVWYAVLLFLVNNSFEICEAVYTISLAVMNIVNDSATSGLLIPAIEEVITEERLSYFATLPGFLALAIFAFIFMLMSFVTLVVVQFVVWGRALQLYAMAAFSPIAIPFLGTEETKPWAMGFIKNFLALCVTGAIILFILLVYPAVMSIAFTPFDTIGLQELVTGSESALQTLNDNLGAMLLWLVKIIAFYCVLIYAMVKSGGWARELLGS